jgi:hypothetical protein
MKRKDCRVIRQEIDQSELNQRLSEEVLAHLASCRDCQDFHAERTRLRELVGSLEPVVAPPDFDMRLRARIAGERQSSSQPFIFRFVVGTPAIAVAFVLMVLAGTAVWYTQRNVNQQIAARPAAAALPVESGVPAPKAIAGNDQGSSISSLNGPAQSSKPPVTLNKRNGNKTTASLAGSNVSDFSSRRAPTFRRIQPQAGEVTVSGPFKPMIISLEDDRGATRTISLPPVTFGSQRLSNNLVPVSMNTTNSRVW